MIAGRLGYHLIDKQNWLLDTTSEVGRLLNGLINFLKGT